MELKQGVEYRIPVRIMTQGYNDGVTGMNISSPATTPTIYYWIHNSSDTNQNGAITLVNGTNWFEISAANMPGVYDLKITPSSLGFLTIGVSQTPYTDMNFYVFKVVPCTQSETAVKIESHRPLVTNKFTFDRDGFSFNYYDDNGVNKTLVKKTLDTTGNLSKNVYQTAFFSTTEPYPALDANSLYVWKLNESGSIYYNSGTAGPADLYPATNAVVQKVQGVYNYAIKNISGGLISGNCFSTPNITTAATISFWVKLTSHVDWIAFITKPYNQTWTSPYRSLGIAATNVSGRYRIYVNFGGTQYYLTATSVIPFNTWTFISGTVLNGTISAYINGVLDGASTPAATTTMIDFGNNGPWTIGADLGSIGMNGIIDDVRVENVARDANYLLAIYNNVIKP